MHNPRGIDPLKALRYKERSGTVVGMPGASRISNEDLLTLKCDILIPAALENVITLHNAEQIKAKIVAEARQRPDDAARRRSAGAQRHFRAAGHSGECRRRDRQLLRMGAESARRNLAGSEVNQKLEFVMRRAFNDVYATMRKYHTHPRAAAYVLAVGRVADATLVRGLFP